MIGWQSWRYIKLYLIFSDINLSNSRSSDVTDERYGKTEYHAVDTKILVRSKA